MTMTATGTRFRNTMKRFFFPSLALVTVGSSVVCAQEFSMPWFAFDARGGASTAGAFTLAGAAAPVSAKPSAGGGFNLVGGVWSFASVVASPGAPALRVQAGAGVVILAWPSASDGYQLQGSISLTTPAWNDVTAVPGVVGVEKQVIVPAQPGQRFFRLQKN